MYCALIACFAVNKKFMCIIILHKTQQFSSKFEDYLPTHTCTPL